MLGLFSKKCLSQLDRFQKGIATKNLQFLVIFESLVSFRGVAFSSIFKTSIFSSYVIIIPEKTYPNRLIIQTFIIT